MCKFLKDSICTLAKDVINIEVSTTPKACECCQKLDTPMTLNHVTVSLCITELHKARAFDKLAHAYLLSALEKGIPEKGPGSILKETLAWFVTTPPNCSCEDRSKIMNLWGPTRCLENIDTILDWLEESAKINGKVFNRAAASVTVRACCYISRRI